MSINEEAISQYDVENEQSKARRKEIKTIILIVAAKEAGKRTYKESSALFGIPLSSIREYNAVVEKYGEDPLEKLSRQGSVVVDGIQVKSLYELHLLKKSTEDQHRYIKTKEDAPFEVFEIERPTGAKRLLIKKITTGGYRWNMGGSTEKIVERTMLGNAVIATKRYMYKIGIIKKKKSILSGKKYL